MKQDNKPSVYGWEDCPASVKKKTEGIVTFLRRSLADDLTGIYLHGSLAMGCFNPASSDIDLLVVVNNKLTVPQKKQIIAFFQGIDNGAASPEMSIVTLESLKPPVYPSPFELHYSNTTREAYTGGQVSWEEQRADTDLPAHFMMTKKRGICLYGEPIEKVFPDIPPEIFIASIVQDMHWIKQEITRLPFAYAVLNPCRALGYISEDKAMSKQEGGEWALSHLPPEYSTLIETALNAYSGAQPASPPSLDSLRKFIDYAVNELIFMAAKTDAEKLFFKRSY
jgi:streptomycin 3"-adenylyltransferase